MCVEGWGGGGEEGEGICKIEMLTPHVGGGGKPVFWRHNLNFFLLKKTELHFHQISC